MDRKNIKRLFFEFTGSLGDIGTFLPIACGLILINKVNGTSLFLTAGLFYILAGAYFRIPIPVQPLKATSALAMAIGASAATLSLVGLFMSAFLFGVAFLNLDKLIARLFKRPIIRGIQLGLAIILIKGGLKLIFTLPNNTVVFAAGNSLDLYQAFFLLFLPQVPLTLANSIYATQDTAQIYFKDKSGRVTPKALCVSLGISNLASAISGGIPLCHGSSGLTAHYRFGARSGLCGVFAGCIFILIALAFKTGAGNIIGLIPLWVLGLSLIYIGIRHGALIRDIVCFTKEFSVALIIGLYTLIFGNLAVAFSIGIIVNFMLNNPLYHLKERTL